MIKLNNIASLFIPLCFIFLVGCQSEDEFTGREFMPDMKHSIAYEANYYNYYSYNTWGTEGEYYDFAKPRLPVKHTIPIGNVGMSASPSIKATMEMKEAHRGIPMNGYVPFDYENTEAERTRASETILENPIPISTEGMARGSELYNIYCGICHGAKADGNGYLVRDGSPYPAQPANLISEEFQNASNGRFYFSIMHGKNVMGGYSEKLSYEERWQVIHYIRSLQAKELKKVYSETENTLNVYDTPMAQLQDSIEFIMKNAEAPAMISDDGANNFEVGDETEVEEQ